jgi:hypothetical protein
VRNTRDRCSLRTGEEFELDSVVFCINSVASRGVFDKGQYRKRLWS